MKRIWNVITALKNATGNIIFVAIIVAIIVALVNQDSTSVPESAVMIVDPEGLLVEQKQSVDPFEQLFMGEQVEDAETLYRDVVDAINLAAEDQRIKAIALDISKLRGSTLSQYEAVGKAIDNFQDNNKQVFAFAAEYSQSQYYLASHADKVYLDKDSHPWLGGVFLQGFGAYPLYMKSALDKLQVDIHVFKAGLYKDAAETYVRDDMSDFSREANQNLVNQLWKNYLSNIAEQREISSEQIVDYVESYADKVEQTDPNTLAIEAGLIDEAISRVQWRSQMQEISGKSGDSYNHIGYRSYLSAVRPPIPVENPAADKIAVVVAKGTILDGDQPAGTAGGDTLARLIRNARNDDTVKALVLRVDSPGGSVTASELIRSELALTQASGKPVVASMGGYAASGGYWISSTANKIFASESTITGSIGVFALFPTLERSLSYLGLNTDGVGTTSMSGAFLSSKSVNPEFAKTVQSSVNRSYGAFLELITDGRGLSLQEADEVAQGRVWTGTEALDHGLIDAIGDLDEAVESAAILADVDNYDVVYLEKQLTPQELFLRELLRQGAMVTSKAGLGIGSQVSLIEYLPKEVSVLARMIQNPGLYMQCISCNVTF